MSAKSRFLAIRLVLLGLAVLSFVAAAVFDPPMRFVFVVFGTAMGLAWLIGMFASNYFRRQQLRQLREGGGDQTGS